MSELTYNVRIVDQDGSDKLIFQIASLETALRLVRKHAKDVGSSPIRVTITSDGASRADVDPVWAEEVNATARKIAGTETND